MCPLGWDNLQGGVCKRERRNLTWNLHYPTFGDKFATQRKEKYEYSIVLLVNNGLVGEINCVIVCNAAPWCNVSSLTISKNAMYQLLTQQQILRCRCVRRGLHLHDCISSLKWAYTNPVHTPQWARTVSASPRCRPGSDTIWHIYRAAVW